MMESVPRFPVHLALAGHPVLVVGGGAVALRRARSLAACGALVTVVAPAVEAELRQLDAVTVEQRPYEPGEAAQYQLVVAATDDAEVNRLVCADAQNANVWANDASMPDGGAVGDPRGSAPGTGPGVGRHRRLEPGARNVAAGRDRRSVGPGGRRAGRARSRRPDKPPAMARRRVACMIGEQRLIRECWT